MKLKYKITSESTLTAWPFVEMAAWSKKNGKFGDFANFAQDAFKRRVAEGQSHLEAIFVSSNISVKDYMRLKEAYQQVAQSFANCHAKIIETFDARRCFSPNGTLSSDRIDFSVLNTLVAFVRCNAGPSYEVWSSLCTQLSAEDEELRKQFELVVEPITKTRVQVLTN